MGRELCVTGLCTKLAKSWNIIEKKVNEKIAKSKIGKYFKLEARKSCFTTEFRAGTATFLTMAYIITINANILADSGGTCSAADCTFPANQTHASPDCMFKPNTGYDSCVNKVRSDLIVGTALSSMIGSFAMGVLANLPLGLAPGMGPNAYLAYNLVGFHGSGTMSYQTVMAIFLIEGLAFLIIAALGLRGRLARFIPHPVRLAFAAGIGLFIAFVGLQGHQGMGLVGPDVSTLVTLTACSGINPVTGECTGEKMRSPTFWLSVGGFIVMCYGLMKNMRGSMMYGIVFVTLISWIRNTCVTFFPNTPAGNSSYEYFKKVVDFHKIESTFGAISFSNFNKGEVLINLVTFLYIDVLATTGTLYTMAEVGGLMDEKGEFEGEYVAYMVDAGATIVASTLGVSPIATFVESSAGIREGGRTGLTAITVGFYFFLSLFFAPLFASVPPWAIGPSLVMVGVLMMKVVKDVDWDNIKHAVPAFVTMVLMPLTYSIPNGVIGGIGVYVALNLYDNMVDWFKWLTRMRKMVVKEQNQVSATNAADQSIEII